MNIVRNTNARGNVLDKFNECKEYVNFETDALLLTLAMKYFSITSVDTAASEVIPPSILEGSKELKTEWLYHHVKEMIKQYIVAPQAEDLTSLQMNISKTSGQYQSLKCRHPGCSSEFRYERVRINHEKKADSLGSGTTSDKTDTAKIASVRDDVFNYCTARLNLGLLIRNADDAVKEGDGERIIRCWKLFMLFYKAFGHHKYAYAAFSLQSKVSAIFTQAQAEQLVWNRTVNRKGGRGKNISCDLRLEQLNCTTKELLYNLGVNLEEASAKRESLAVGFLEKMLERAQEESHTTSPSGHHKAKKKEDDMKQLVQNLVSKRIFEFTNGRKNEQFKDFNRNILAKLDASSLSSWLSDHLKQLSKKYPS